MDYTFLLEDGHMTVYECSKKSGIPYSTLADLFRGRTQMEKISFKTAHDLAETLGMTMDELYKETHVPVRKSFETFKSQVRHELKRMGDIEFIKGTIDDDAINRFWRWGWYLEAFYLLGMLDYLYSENGIAPDSRYDSFRDMSLPETVYPMDINLAAKIGGDPAVRSRAVKESIPEFYNYNIVEKDVRDVF